ncbi:hypothetical protein P4S63_02165 [Pseudoalteromonas sp. B193]
MDESDEDILHWQIRQPGPKILMIKTPLTLKDQPLPRQWFAIVKRISDASNILQQ